MPRKSGSDVFPSDEAESLEVPQTPGPIIDDYRSLILSDTPLLDVRAPVEFSKGAFPTSSNQPLLSDDERHLVGIRYKQANQQAAIALGAKLVTPQLRCERVAAWIDFFRQHPDGALYCFRGGLRSRITQQWLMQAGVNVPLVKGGYKALRRYLISELERLCQNLEIRLIGGRTGSGKTLLVRRLGAMVDLEALANHRGSSFGGMGNDQPGNIDFENALTVCLMKLEQCGYGRVFMEDEARLIGRVCLPEPLRQAMQRAPILTLECSLEERIRNCFDDYVSDLLKRYQQQLGVDSGFQAYAKHHRDSLSRIQKRFGPERYRRASQMLEEAIALHKYKNDTSAYAEFIEFLLLEYYDPMYDYQLGKKQHRIIARGNADELLKQAGE